MFFVPYEFGRRHAHSVVAGGSLIL